RIRYFHVTVVQTCALPICPRSRRPRDLRTTTRAVAVGWVTMTAEQTTSPSRAPQSSGQAVPADHAAAHDPYLWLEDVDGDEALAWVRARNAEVAATLETADAFTTTERAIREVLDSDAKIPRGPKTGAR